MNPQSRIMLALGRVSAVTSILRTRHEQDARDAANGAPPVELNRRMTATADRVEALARDMERLV